MGGRDGGAGEGTCVVHVPESRFEADILCDALQREGIVAACRRHEETAYDGIFVPQRGWGAILVPLLQRERAEEIVREVLETYGKGPPDPSNAMSPP
jgi:hypothetical protein